MSRLLDLANAARSTGLPVVEVAGWKTRYVGSGTSSTSDDPVYTTPPQGIVVHHTGTSASAAGDYPTMGIIKAGVPGLRGPLAQLGLGRSGTVYVCAAGYANHAGPVDDPRYRNGASIGIEAEHSGTGPWPALQYSAYVRLCAGLRLWYGSIANARGHKEVAVPAGRKVDPNFDMSAFRTQVSAAMTAKNAGASGGAATVPISLTDRVRALQSVLETPADGVWGDTTERRAAALRAVARGGGDLTQRRLTQSIVDVAVDGIVGAQTRAGVRSHVTVIQRRALIVPADGVWGQRTDDVYAAFRAKARA